MKRTRLASLWLLGSLTLAPTAFAQAGDPPPPEPAAPTPDPNAPAPAPAAPDPAAPAPAAPAPAAPATGWGQPAPAGPGASGGASWNTNSGFDGSAQAGGAGSGEMDAETEREWRRTSLQIQNSLTASTGLLHTTYAGSGAPGTLRVSFITSYFKKTGYLCKSGDCNFQTPPEGSSDDEVTRIGAHLGMNVTLASFIEAYLGFHASATENSQSRPRLLQVLGDTDLGLKAFMPHSPDQIFSAGGELQLWALNGTGGVGLDGSGTSYAIRALATLDPSNRTDPNDRVPLRANLNLGYHFDKSGELVKDTEDRRNQSITRIERFGLDINRVDNFEIGLGLEGVFDYIHPFAEFSIDIPMNRQDYVCNESRVEEGDGCLGNDSGFKTTPSRVTLGAKGYPPIDGLSFLLAADIGTGATSNFIQEVAPEAPWTVYLGIAFAADTKKEPPIVKEVPVERIVQTPVAADRYVAGTVVEKGANTPVPGAIIKFDGRPITGMVSNDDGTFRTINLDPGTYTFSVKATGYRDGTCQATIPATGAAPGAGPGWGAPAPAGPGPAPMGPGPAPMGPYAAPAAGPTIVPVTCELEALPKVGNIVGTVLDGENSQPVTGATVKITDNLNRELELSADASGAFRFENVPPGASKITVNAPGYFTSITELEVQPQQDLKAAISLNKRPKTPNVVVAGNELKLKKQVHFAHDSANIEPDSASLLEEMADVMQKKPELSKIEIQGHTDNTGSPVYNQRLSQQRADAVRAALVKLGVDGGRLSSKGYGQDKPLVPNVSAANRARNRRVQLIITEKAK